jgi:hypothetical protein
MSKAFVERFKGRMEHVNKGGINGLISSAQNPIAKQSTHDSYPMYEMNEEPKTDDRKFSKNAQTNILDFNRNYQSIINDHSRPANPSIGSLPRSFENRIAPRVVQSSTDYNRMANSYGHQGYPQPHFSRPPTHADYQQYSTPQNQVISPHEFPSHPQIYSRTAYGQQAPPINPKDYFYASIPMPGTSDDPMSYHRQAQQGPNGSQISEQANPKGYFSIHTSKQEQSIPKPKPVDRLFQKENFNFGGLGPNFTSDWHHK